MTNSFSLFLIQLNQGEQKYVRLPFGSCIRNVTEGSRMRGAPASLHFYAEEPSTKQGFAFTNFLRVALQQELILDLAMTVSDQEPGFDNAVQFVQAWRFSLESLVPSSIERSASFVGVSVEAKLLDYMLFPNGEGMPWVQTLKKEEPEASTAEADPQPNA